MRERLESSEVISQAQLRAIDIGLQARFLINYGTLLA
jgi:hypothetical protein